MIYQQYQQEIFIAFFLHITIFIITVDLSTRSTVYLSRSKDSRSLNAHLLSNRVVYWLESKKKKKTFMEKVPNYE